MKAVMISRQPKWVEKIVKGEKTIDVRKTCPKLKTPFKCFIYCTKETKKGEPISYMLENGKYFDTGKVIGEFICDKIKTFNYITKRLDNHEYKAYNIHNKDLTEMCLSKYEITTYGKGKPLYGLHISNLIIYDTPKEINEFKGRKLVWRGMNHIHAFEELKIPPQSWCYVEI